MATSDNEDRRLRENEQEQDEEQVFSYDRNDPPVRRVIGIVALIVLGESLAATILFPFIVFMVRSFPHIEEDRVGWYCGLITSSYFIPQMFLAPVYGLISDRIGRKPILIFGLLGASICTFRFGMAQSLTAAMISRACVGFFNGTAPVSRSCLGEFSNQVGLNKAKAMGVFGFCFSLGSIIGPLIGGYLSKPDFRGPAGAFAEYPYLLPCAVLTVYNWFTAVVTFLCLPETNIHRRPLRKDQVTKPPEEQPLLPSSENSRRQAHMSAVFLIIMGQGILALHAVVFDEMYPVIAASAPPIGYGFTAKQIARSLLVLGPFAIFTQLVCYPWLSKRVSYVSSWRISSVLFLFIYGIFPLLPGPESAPAWLEWMCLLFALAIRIAGLVIGYTSIAVLVIDIVPPQQVGMYVGFSQTAMSAGRAIGPALGGMAWSWGLRNNLPAPWDEHCLYLLQMFLACLQFLTSFGLKAARDSMMPK
ncbi:hypothetical protein CKM354_000907200 [Cercospora kikuchii]|uniref:Major facilitator superfamily (MFS) profile domain-containing protein n=1 Tax=Cercospora kikuchii TaxID=84275 RepID=A0A9P3CNM4_9PEZI|nr:uncharacterized protein CKM354_000907200 [Cercospora kikuchii]GIZ45926.1 hypothetical protein CKM354_000907200 [Cercospora kikuchii]